MLERSEPRSPQDLAQEFVRVIGYVTTPPASTGEKSLEDVVGGQLTIRSFEPGGRRRGVPTEFASRIQDMAGSLLDAAQITSAFKQHLLKVLEEQLQSGILRMAGPDLILSQSGIVLEQGRFGIFDPAQATEVEKRAIEANYPNPYIIDELAIQHTGKMDAWVDEFRKKHPDVQLNLT